MSMGPVVQLCGSPRDLKPEVRGLGVRELTVRGLRVGEGAGVFGETLTITEEDKYSAETETEMRTTELELETMETMETRWETMETRRERAY